MALYRDQAIVLRTQKLGEADRIITLFTKDHGRLRAVAKGVRRTKSRFGARLEPTSYVDLQLYTGKTFDIVTQAESIENFGDSLSNDYQNWTIASAILEAAERFTAQEHEPALQQYLLVVGALKALAHNTYDSSLILDAYLLRSLSVAGYAPSLTNCSRCDKPGPHKYFSLVGGGSVCTDCKPAAAATPLVETLQLMSDLQTGDWDGAIQSELRNRREASGLIAAYLQWHLERGLRSLPLVERI
ncbi:MAG: DNA repair protein RecO [Actinomycetes bacterium]|jgi:DNA repair protein RecO (recombination protein O)